MHPTIKRTIRPPLFWNTSKRGNKLSVLYIVFSALAAMLGYYFILCFPTLFFISAYKVSVLLPFYPVSDNSTEILWWITLSIFFAHTSFNILSIDFAGTALQVRPTGAGRLFQLLDDISAHYFQPAIHRIVVTDNHELKLMKIPRFGIPLFTHNTLVMGLPLMLTVSPNHFKCLVIREIIQHSKRRGKIASWLNHLRDSWERYRRVLKPRACIGHQLLHGFFSLYCPLYDSIVLPARIADELSADRNALDLVNSDELFNAFQAKQIGKIYFAKYFLPEITRSNLVNPFSRLQRVARSALSQNNSDKWLHGPNPSTDLQFEHFPTLQQRMENLGVTAVNLPPDLTQTAAEFYFHNHLAGIIRAMDRRWLERLAPESSPRAAAWRLTGGAVKGSCNSQKHLY